MQEIRMKTISARPDGIRHLGKIYRVPKGEAATLVKGDFAEYATITPPEKAIISPPEAAVDAPEETASEPKGKNKKRNQ